MLELKEIVSITCGAVHTFFLYFTEVLMTIWERSMYLKKPYAERNIGDCNVIVTGANSGIGKATVIEFAKRGATVILACRNLVEGQKVIDEILKKNIVGDSSKLDLIELNLAELRSVRKFAETVKSRYTKVDILVNNGGIFDSSGIWKKTLDGFESHMGVNHLGHFLLTNLLLELIQKGGSSRVITVSSSVQRFTYQYFNLEDLMLTKTTDWGFFNGLAYGYSKFSNALFAKELNERIQKYGGLSYSICPGYVETNIFRDTNLLKGFFVSLTYKMFGINAEQGCATTVYLACARDPPPGGKFYRLKKYHRRINEELKTDLATKLWDASEKLVGMRS